MIDLGSIQLKDIRIGTQQVKKVYLGSTQVYPAGEPVISDVAIGQFTYPNISYQGGTYNPIIDITYTLTYPNGDTSEEHGLPEGYSLYYWITWASSTVTDFVTVDSSTGVLTVQANAEFSTRSFYVHVQLNGPSGNVSSASVTLTQQAYPRQYITLTLGYTSAGWVSVTASQAVVDSLTIIVQLYDDRICVLSQYLHVIECVFEHIVVEFVYDVFGHAENSKSYEERFHYFPQRCIQLETDQILGIHGGSHGHNIFMLLDDSLAFIPCGGELHFHSFQFSLHEFAICQLCQ